MKSLNLIAGALERLQRGIGAVVSWGTLAMVLITFAVVVLRYAFSIGWVWMQETISYLHSAVFLLAGGYTLDQGGHVRVDIFYRTASPRSRALVDLLGSCFLLLPTCALIFLTAQPFVVASWQVSETSPEPGGLPFVYLLKTLVLAYAGLLSISAGAMSLRSLAVLAGAEGAEGAPPAPPSDAQQSEGRGR